MFFYMATTLSADQPTTLKLCAVAVFPLHSCF